MKTSSFNLLAVSAAFFALCVSGMAAAPKSIIRTACLKCHGGASVSGDLDFGQVLTREQKLDALAKAARGEMPVNGPKLTPVQFAQLKKELGLEAAVVSSAPDEAPTVFPLSKRPDSKRDSLKALKSESSKAFTLPAQPQVHGSWAEPSDGAAKAGGEIVPTGSPTAKPISKARVASVASDKTPGAAVARPKYVVKSQAGAADTLKGDDVEKLLDMLSTAKEDSAKNSDTRQRLKGDGVAISRQGDGEPWTVVLQMDDNSWEKLTIPSADGESSM